MEFLFRIFLRISLNKCGRRSSKKARSCNFPESDDEAAFHTSLIYKIISKKKTKKQFVPNRAQVISPQIKDMYFSLLTLKLPLTFSIPVAIWKK